MFNQQQWHYRYETPSPVSYQTFQYLPLSDQIIYSKDMKKVWLVLSSSSHSATNFPCSSSLPILPFPFPPSFSHPPFPCLSCFFSHFFFLLHSSSLLSSSHSDFPFSPSFPLISSLHISFLSLMPFSYISIFSQIPLCSSCTISKKLQIDKAVSFMFQYYCIKSLNLFALTTGLKCLYSRRFRQFRLIIIIFSLAMSQLWVFFQPSVNKKNADYIILFFKIIRVEHIMMLLTKTLCEH